jgi:hypothetical protein
LNVALVRQAWTVKVSNRRRPSSPPRSAFAGFRFPPDVIMVAVRLYLRYDLSYRDVEELVLERGVEVDHVTVFRWVQRFTLLLADAARFCRHAPGDRWFTDETYVKVNGVWRYVYLAVDCPDQPDHAAQRLRRDDRTRHRHLKTGPALARMRPPIGKRNSAPPPDINHNGSGLTASYTTSADTTLAPWVMVE